MSEKSGAPKNVVETPPKYPHILFNPKVLAFFYFLDACGLVLLYYLFKSSNSNSNLPMLFGGVDSGLGYLQGAQHSNKSTEIIELSYPFIPKASYGEPVHSALLIDHKFDSQGCPGVELFTPPKDTDYNKVVLTLNVSVDGVYYERLGHLFVGGAEVWRTSTPQVGPTSVYLSVKKDITEYVSLFREKTGVVFKLDTIPMGEEHNPVFHVQLSANFYLSEYFHSADAQTPGVKTETESTPDKNEIYKYFDIRGAASKVYPLFRNNSLPLVYYPTQELAIQLPKVSQNTTRLKLNIFASGESLEKNWYSNVLDKFVGHAINDDNTLIGHGPLRFVTVWLDGKKLASQAPQPFISTSTFSPLLWAAVAPINAFDLPSIDLDISPILPYLWDSEEHEVRISVENGLDEVQDENSGIGIGWTLSANLLTYEKPDIKSVSGKVLDLSDSKKGSSVGITLPYNKNIIQNAKGLFKAFVESQFLVELKSGEVLNATMASSFTGQITNIQNYRDLGRVADIVHTGTSEKSFSLTIDEEVIRSSDIRLHNFLTFKVRHTPVKGGEDMDVSFVNVKVLDLDVDEKPAMKETQKQEGTSALHSGESGNYGTGSLLSKFKIEVHGPDYGFVYKRRVKVEEDEITEDENSFKRE